MLDIGCGIPLPGVFNCSITSYLALSENEIGLAPGGALSTFCAPVYSTSIPANIVNNYTGTPAQDTDGKVVGRDCNTLSKTETDVQYNPTNQYGKKGTRNFSFV